MTLKFKGKSYKNLSKYRDAKMIPESHPILDGCGFNSISEEQNNKLNYILVKNGKCNWRFQGLRWEFEMATNLNVSHPKSNYTF